MCTRGTVILSSTLVALAISCATLRAATLTHEWSERIGGRTDDGGRAIAADAAGNVLVTGYCSGTVDLGGGPLTSAGGCDIFVAKFDPGGNHTWSKRFGGSSIDVDRGYGIATDKAGNVLVTGSFSGTVDFGGGPLTSAGGSDIFVAKFDPSGNHLWSGCFGGSNADEGQSITTDVAGAVLVTGYFSETADFGGNPLTSAGGSDAFVAKFGSGGTHLWSERIGGSDPDRGQGVATDTAGNVLVTGSFSGTADFGGGPLTSAGGRDIFVAKFDSGGNHMWSGRFGGSVADVGSSIAADRAGNVVVTGYFQGTADFGGGPLTSAGAWDVFVAKFDSRGHHAWSARFGGWSLENGRSITTDAAGFVLVTGSVRSTVDFGGGPLTPLDFDMFVAKFDPGGNHVWSRCYGESYGGVGRSLDLDNHGNGIATDPAGNVLVTGIFNWTADFGGGPMTSAGDWDIFIAKFSSSPERVDAEFSPQTLNRGSRGRSVRVEVLPTGAFGVDEIDPTSILLEGVAAGSARLEGGVFVARFPRQEVGALLPVGMEVPVTLTGRLRDGRAFSATDTIRVIDPSRTGRVRCAPAYPAGALAEVEWLTIQAEETTRYDAYISTDGGRTWAKLFEGLRGVNRYSWRLQDDMTGEAEVLVEATAPQGVHQAVTRRFTIGAVAVDPPRSAVTGYALEVSPNPFNPRTTVQYALPTGGVARIVIFDLAGRRIRTLVSGYVDAGRHEAHWDGRDEQGRTVASGVYLYRLVAGGFAQTNRMVLLK